MRADEVVRPRDIAHNSRQPVGEDNDGWRGYPNTLSHRTAAHIELLGRMRASPPTTISLTCTDHDVLARTPGIRSGSHGTVIRFTRSQ